jgi:hypothetical protein
MTDAERAVSLTNVGHVVWNGVNVRTDVAKVLQPGTPVLQVDLPVSLAGGIRVGTADFGPPLSSPGVSGELVLAMDSADDDGPSLSDACSPLVMPILSARFTAVHAIHLTADEIAALGKQSVHVCACPTTERNLGDGAVPEA